MLKNWNIHIEKDKKNVKGNNMLKLVFKSVTFAYLFEAVDEYKSFFGKYHYY